MNLFLRKSLVYTISVVMAFSAWIGVGVFKIPKAKADFEPVVQWDFNDGDLIVDNNITANLGKTLTTEGTSLPATGTYDGAIYAKTTGWVGGMNAKYWKTSFSTLGYGSLSLSFKQRSTNSGPKDFLVQYSTDGVIWNTLGEQISLADSEFYSFARNLDTACNNQSVLSLRWIMADNSPISGALIDNTNGASGLDDILVMGEQQDFNTPKIDKLSITLDNEAIVGTISNGYYVSTAKEVPITNPVPGLHQVSVADIETNISLKEAEFPFYYQSTSTPAVDLTEYFRDKLADPEQLNQMMTEITPGIGQKPTFYLKIDALGHASLVDSFMRAMRVGDLPMQIDRNFPEGTYIYSGQIESLAGIKNLIEVKLTIDNSKPVVSGIENGITYTSNRIITITDSNLKSVTIDGKAFKSGDSYGNDGEHELIAEDLAGNKTTIDFMIDKPVEVSIYSKDILTNQEDNVVANGDTISVFAQFNKTVENPVLKIGAEPLSLVGNSENTWTYTWDVPGDKAITGSQTLTITGKDKRNQEDFAFTIPNAFYIKSDNQAEMSSSLENGGGLVLSNAVNEAVIPSDFAGDSNVILTVPSGVDKAYLNLNAIITDNQATLNAPIQIIANSVLGQISVELPKGLQITGAAGWDGRLNLPSLIANANIDSLVESGYQGKELVELEIGAGDLAISFNVPIKLTLPGQAGKKIAFIQNGVLVPIDNECVLVDGKVVLESGKQCKTTSSDGKDAIIWTTHLTKFVAYNLSQIVAIAPNVATTSVKPESMANVVPRNSIAPQRAKAAATENKVETPADDEGIIKGTDTEELADETKTNWTPWIVLFILIILAGAATGGYFYWSSKEEEDLALGREKSSKKQIKKKITKPAAKTAEKRKKIKRW